MNQMRHIFTRHNSLTAQIIDFMNKNIVDIASSAPTGTAMICEIDAINEKNWQSATYDGKINIYSIKITGTSVATDALLARNIETLNRRLADHEFHLVKSFVAEIKINKFAKNDDNLTDDNLTMTIELLIIFEE